MLRTPPHPSDEADRTERLVPAVGVALVTALTALHTAGLAARSASCDPGSQPAQRYPGR